MIVEKSLSKNTLNQIGVSDTQSYRTVYFDAPNLLYLSKY